MKVNKRRPWHRPKEPMRNRRLETIKDWGKEIKIVASLDKNTNVLKVYTYKKYPPKICYIEKEPSYSDDDSFSLDDETEQHDNQTKSSYYDTAPSHNVYDSDVTFHVDTFHVDTFEGESADESEDTTISQGYSIFDIDDMLNKRGNKTRTKNYAIESQVEEQTEESEQHELFFDELSLDQPQDFYLESVDDPSVPPTPEIQMSDFYIMLPDNPNPKKFYIDNSTLKGLESSQQIYFFSDIEDEVKWYKMGASTESQNKIYYLTEVKQEEIITESNNPKELSTKTGCSYDEIRDRKEKELLMERIKIHEDHLKRKKLFYKKYKIKKKKPKDHSTFKNHKKVATEDFVQVKRPSGFDPDNFSNKYEGLINNAKPVRSRENKYLCL